MSIYIPIHIFIDLKRTHTGADIHTVLYKHTGAPIFCGSCFGLKAVTKLK